MTKIDFTAPAELFPSRNRAISQRVKYRRFNKAAEAIQFAMEQLPPIDLLATWLAIDHGHLFPWRTSLWLRLNRLGRCRRWCRSGSGGRWCDRLWAGRGRLW